MNTLANPSSDEDFSLARGGFLYRVLHRFGVTSKEPPKPAQRVALFIGTTWVPLWLLSLLQGVAFGTNVRIPLLYDFTVHIRLLIALPILIVAEVTTAPVLIGVCRHLREVLVDPRNHESHFDAAWKRLARARDSSLAEAILLAMAAGLTLCLMMGPARSRLDDGVATWFAWGGASRERISLAGWWYVIVCSPIFQFLLLRWLWRYFLWSRFLWHVSKMDLQLTAAHPDRAGGLNFLADGQLSFGILFFAGGSVLSAIIGHQIVFDGSTFNALRAEAITFATVFILILVTPLCFFSPKLLRLKQQAGLQYSALGSQMARSFHGRWVAGKKQNDVDILDRAETSALGDYTGIYNTVREMRVLPLDRKTAIVMVVVQVIPYLPLLLTELSIKDLLRRLMQLLM